MGTVLLDIFIWCHTTNGKNDVIPHHNTTIQCIFLDEDRGTLISSFDIRWMALQSFLNSVSLCALSLGGVEFICVQTPYSMRELISGAGYPCMNKHSIKLCALSITMKNLTTCPVAANGSYGKRSSI